MTTAITKPDRHGPPTRALGRASRRIVLVVLWGVTFVAIVLTGVQVGWLIGSTDTPAPALHDSGIAAAVAAHDRHATPSAHDSGIAAALAHHARSTVASDHDSGTARRRD